MRKRVARIIVRAAMRAIYLSEGFERLSHRLMQLADEVEFYKEYRRLP